MNLYEDTNPHELRELLALVHTGQMVLPDFQRDFVWDAGATAELIISIARNYPAGSLLRARNTRNLFACREFEGAPRLNGHRPVFILLDGQQRLTSLYQAFYGVGEIRYYLNLRGLLDGEDFEDCIFNYRSGQPAARRLEDEAVQARELALPLGLLKGGEEAFASWSRRVTNGNGLHAPLDELGQRWLNGLTTYRFPVITLTDAASPEAVCTIFETLNRGGVRLSPFELLTTRFWRQNLNLRELWARAREAHPVLADFGIDPYLVLQVIALLARSTPSIKRGDVLALEKGQIDNGWDDAVYGLRTGIDFLRDECGVLVPDLLPGSALLVPLAGLFARTRHYRGIEVGAAREKIGRWFWCAVFGQKYETGPAAQTAQDYIEGINWLNGGQPPESVNAFRFDPDALRETTTRQRAVYRGALALVLRNQALDFHSQRVLDQKLMQDNHVEDYPIFPSKYLEQRGVTPRQRDCVLNRTLIDRETHARAGDRAPSFLMKDLLRSRGAARLDELLASHLLPAGPDSPFWADDFDDFLAARQAALWDEIQRVTGLLS